ncbi:polyprenyl P-hydroxybenzoate and phenylacrylic acid decarboxylase [Archaeoglobus sulfaticallidus PM70-1]|uniref:Flavin prenyltransferase UbiX n=1 Tax=Archaeoglobus sulfaticallidus PM70-1 TaxID=387631 RepID=N0BIE3_9EURY|nr:UbiX family flavin prenyltransferase [Archaeoglobus sulfaticallidus]AGK60236.1 polyprenyl P-hydroxybenzoate and phenylacrylic acid decarboxylase [Archaeoglobus sulfaticallidus PM70-1]
MKKIVVAITGASGQIYGLRLLQKLKELDVETHVIVSNPAIITMKYEGVDLEDIKDLSDHFYSTSDISSRLASGSFKHDGMVIAPCTVNTASSIAYGIADNLIVRSADVTLKEKRKLILLVRETPLHEGHLETLLKLSRMGTIIMPPVPAFYIKPKHLTDIVDHTVFRVLDLLGFDIEYNRWNPFGND